MKYYFPQIRIKILLLNPGCRTVKLPSRANTMPFRSVQCYPPFSALFLRSPLIMIPHEAEYKKKESELEGKGESVCKRAWYSCLFVIQQRACQQKLVCSSRGKSEACEEVLMCAERAPKQGFNMADGSVPIQPEHHQGNISVVEDNKLHIRLLAVYCEWDIKPLISPPRL